VSININKQKIVDSLFQTVRNKLRNSKKYAREKPAVMLYGNKKFAAPSSGEEGGILILSMRRAAKRHF